MESKQILISTVVLYNVSFKSISHVDHELKILYKRIHTVKKSKSQPKYSIHNRIVKSVQIKNSHMIDKFA